MIIGKGKLAWDRQERISDRYGSICLTESENMSLDINKEKINNNLNTIGNLKAEVLEGNKSSHIGDMTRGLFQMSVPEKSDVYEIGTGELFVCIDCDLYDHPDFSVPFGVKPIDGRVSNDWLNAQALYNLHDCIVKIRFDPSN